MGLQYDGIPSVITLMNRFPIFSTLISDVLLIIRNPIDPGKLENVPESIAFTLGGPSGILERTRPGFFLRRETTSRKNASAYARTSRPLSFVLLTLGNAGAVIVIVGMFATL